MTTSSTEWPSPALAEPIKALITRAFEIGDSAAENSGKRMAQEIFSPTGQMLINQQKFTGSDEIAAAQRAIWSVLTSRRHQISKVYTDGPAGDTFMFFGTVTWTFKDEKVMEANYANRWVVDGADTESPKVLLFQAFADLGDFKAEAKRQQQQ